MPPPGIGVLPERVLFVTVTCRECVDAAAAVLALLPVRVLFVTVTVPPEL